MKKTLHIALFAACALFASQGFAANAACEAKAVDKNGKALAISMFDRNLFDVLGVLAITWLEAMTLAALMLRDTLFAREVSTRLKYATLGVLFVNVSIGGTLTSFAAPPVLMVAAKWNWDMAFMLTHFGWKAAIAVTVNALAVAFLFREHVSHMAPAVNPAGKVPVRAAAALSKEMLDGYYHDEAEKVFAPAVALRVDPNAPAGDDPYADPQYQVPDDLVW